MGLFDLTLDENVAVVTMNSGENRFNFSFFEAFLKMLDEIERETEASALVVTSAHEKIFSNGIDLDWLIPAVQKGGAAINKKFQSQMYALFRRILTYPMITVAAINGHAFAGGAIMACAFDFRFMRSDRGWFCFPEVDIKIPFTQTLNALVKKAIPMYKLIEMQYTGKRLTARECEEHHIVVKACHLDDLMDEVLAFAKAFNKDRESLRTMKEMLSLDIIRVMEQDLASE
ncbi:MAG: enoyl-CoA hydratase/isomerase family protein [Deltaproteobacteria bacterium]|nr:enoyl-CoA hydratase/isomerase family protein [Deltaproteobacteria bacterium]MBW2086141.1 enoyl-CoA hydratase/isomerase family protein [Deltaproteobacteria bacterium]